MNYEQSALLCTYVHGLLSFATGVCTYHPGYTLMVQCINILTMMLLKNRHSFIGSVNQEACSHLGNLQVDPYAILEFCLEFYVNRMGFPWFLLLKYMDINV